MKPPPPPPPPRARFTIRQIMIVTGCAAVLFALAAPTARTRGWAAAFGFIAIYVVAMAILVRVLGVLGRPY
jgi:hypothetical protein